AQPLDFEKPIAELEQKLEDMKKHLQGQAIDMDPEVQRIAARIEETRREVYSKLTAWQRVQIARHTQRPFFLDYIERAFTDFVELHGDRLFGDDASMPAGLATIGDRRCVVIGQQKGRDVKENLLRNFGSPHPEGDRKALRLMRMAEKFQLPVVCLIDTPGAYPGVGAEERHIGEAIAVNIREMMVLRTPIIAVVLGEGGSGGALGIGVADRVLMLENAYYSVISPEGCAAILWKHRKHAPEAAEALRINADALLEMKVVDGIVEEPLGGAHQDHAQAAEFLKASLEAGLAELSKIPMDDLLEQRYQKYRAMGVTA
ncbi:MAG: acetyl-CoA carboxylase carboxyltransferase subunit alpha, partial [Chthoniobacterales bacterium]